MVKNSLRSDFTHPFTSLVFAPRFLYVPTPHLSLSLSLSFPLSFFRSLLLSVLFRLFLTFSVKIYQIVNRLKSNFKLSLKFFLNPSYALISPYLRVYKMILKIWKGELSWSSGWSVWVHPRSKRVRAPVTISHHDITFTFGLINLGNVWTF